MKLHLPKSLFIAVLAATGAVTTSWGDVITVNALEAPGDWILRNGSNAEAVKLSNGGSNYMTYEFERVLSASAEQALTFTLTLNLRESTWNDGYDFLTGVTFGGSSSAFAIGKFEYKADESFGYSYGGNGSTQFFSHTGGNYASSGDTVSVTTDNWLFC